MDTESVNSGARVADQVAAEWRIANSKALIAEKTAAAREWKRWQFKKRMARRVAHQLDYRRRQRRKRKEQIRNRVWTR